MRIRNFQSNFTGGLLSEGMLGRIDLAAYENGCRQLKNWWPLVTGGVMRRPGTLFITNAFDTVRIEPFIFSESQTYIVGFTPTESVYQEIRIWRPSDGALVGVLQSPNIPVLANLTETVIKQLSITQAADTMLIAHESFRTQKLVRTGASSFELRDFEFDDDLDPSEATTYKKCPFFKFANTEYQLGASSDFGTVTLTVTDNANNPVNYFQAGHVGTRIRYRGKQAQVVSVPNPPSSTCEAVVIERFDKGQILQIQGLTGIGSDFIIGEIIVGRDSGVKAEVIATEDNPYFITGQILVANLGGRFYLSETVEGLESGSTSLVSVVSDVPPPASRDWQEEAFSDVYGWPGVIEFHSQRLWLGGSSSLPAHIFGSKAAAFFNFDAGDAEPADSIQVVIADKQVNVIHDIVGGRDLYVFTDAGEYYAPYSAEQPLTPANFQLLRQSRYGNKKEISPQVFDEATVFVQTNGSSVREFLYQDRFRGYTSSAISLISDTTVRDIQDMAVLYAGYDRPEQIIFFVNGDGTIAWYHAARAEQIRMWGLWDTNGKFKNIFAMNDKLYALVERTLDTGTVVNYVEEFSFDATCDCMRFETNASPQTSWPGAGLYLPGTAVHVTSGLNAGDADWYLGEFTTSNPAGDLTLDFPVDNIGVGLNFVQTLEPMPYEVRDGQGVTGGLPKRLVSVDVYMASTLALRLNGKSIKTFAAQNDWGQPPTPFTGSKKFYLFGYDERPSIVLTNDIPLRCEVLAINTEVEY